MKITLPKLNAADVLGIAIVVGTGVFAGLHSGLHVGVAPAGEVASAVVGLLGYAIPVTAIEAAAAPLETLVDDAARAVATGTIAASIPKLTTDALNAVATFIAEQAAATPVPAVPKPATVTNTSNLTVEQINALAKQSGITPNA